MLGYNDNSSITLPMTEIGQKSAIYASISKKPMDRHVLTEPNHWITALQDVS
jgi:hypothetical protein